MQTSKPKLIWICSSCRLLGIYFTIQWNWIQIRNFNLVFRNYVASHYMAFNRVSVICSLVWIQIGRFLPPTQSHIPCYRRPTKRPPDQKVIKLPRKTALWPSGGDEEPGWRGREKVLYEEVMKKFFMELLPSSNPRKKMPSGNCQPGLLRPMVS